MKKTEPLLLISNETNRSDIRHLCGIDPPESTLLLQMGRSITLLVSEMESNRVRRTVKAGISVFSPPELGVERGGKLSQSILKLLEKMKIRCLAVSPSFPLGLAEALRAEKIEIKITSKPPCPRREIKNMEEIQAVRLSQCAAVAAMKAAIDQIASAEIAKDGTLLLKKTALTSQRVRATICHTLLDHDCIAEETIVAGGSFSADPHERGSGPLRAGEPIVIDIFPKSGKTGYWGDITRTVCRGPAPAALKKQYNAVKAAQAAQLKAVQAGAWMDKIHQIGVDVMEARGFKTETINQVPQGFTHGTGHGVGLEIHEAPRVSAATHQKLRAGHIITIEPGLYYPEIGGVRIEDTILVTNDGYKMLASCLKKLEI